jgi:Methyltransferase domain
MALTDRREWSGLVTLDIDPHCNAHVLADLEGGLPFRDAVFEEVHVYDVLEHLGRQGDFRAFFRDFAEIDRVLKPGGTVHGITPYWGSHWLWSDPGHTRSISLDTLAFLDQSKYEREVGVTAMTDYRWLWKGDLRVIASEVQDASNIWILQKHPATV